MFNKEMIHINVLCTLLKWYSHVKMWLMSLLKIYSKEKHFLKSLDISYSPTEDSELPSIRTPG